MLYWMCKKSRGLPLTWPQMKHAIMRNFGGLKSEKVNPFQEFCSQLNMADEEPNPNDYEDFEEVCTYYFICLYHIAGNFGGVLIFVLNLTVTKFCTKRKFATVGKGRLEKSRRECAHDCDRPYGISLSC